MSDFSTCCSCSSRMRFLHSLMTWPVSLQSRHIICCCSAVCGCCCSVMVVAVVAFVGIEIIYLFPARLIWVRFLDVELFDRMCYFLGKLGLLTVWDLGLIWSTVDYLSFVVQRVPMVDRNNHCVPRRNLINEWCWYQKCVFAICVLLWLLIMVWRTFAGM